MRLTKGAQTQHNPNPNIQCWRNIFSRKWEKGKESEHFFSSVTLSSLLFPLVWNLVKPLIYSSEFVNFVSFSHLGPFFFVFCIVNLAWFVKIQVGFCFMWSGFDLIGLGYVYLQPWFDFFFNHNSWFECYDFWCNLLYCDCFNIDSSFGFWFCAFIVFMVLW